MKSMIAPQASALALLAFSTLTQADPLPDCETWLQNRAPLAQNKLPAISAEQLKSAGLTVEPSRRMRAKDYPWEHEVQVALPPTYGKTDRRYPVLWVMDGHFFFNMAAGLVASCANKQWPEMIVVAIGAPPEALNEAQMRRNFDFTPNEIPGYSGFGSKIHNEKSAAIEKKLKAEGKVSNDRMGGAPRFLPFVVDEIRGALVKAYRMEDDHTLFGDSGGGLFCGYALMARPVAFSRYICGSPALAGSDFEVFRLEERYAQANKDLEAAVFFGMGEAEVLQGGTWGIVSSTARMGEILKSRAYPSLKLYFRIFPNENHISVIPLNLGWGLKDTWKGEFKAEGR